MQFQSAEYVRSAGTPEQFLRDPFPKMVFAGRSNVGKSSVINRLTGRKNLARVGASPGKTRQIHYFLVDNSLYLVDLPGYGYAKVPKEEKARWANLMEQFFKTEGPRISGGVLIVDIRHRPTADDVTMYQWFRDSGCPVAVAANKLDKLKKREIEPALTLIRETLRLRPSDPLISFSAEKGHGKEALTAYLLDCRGGNS
ncbi:MAG: YihA family ribosome biogenesis GTP-binding protein [Oscillibacter sp.]|nr:YihA family ribosome biogenesis GTP-binding protein [Oscillibacter sp.]